MIGRRRFAPALSFLMVAAAAGCAGAGGPPSAQEEEEGPGGTAREATREATAASAPERTAESAVPPEFDAEPPDSTLGSGDRAVAGVLGSYCWSSGSVASCVDGAYNPVPGEGETLVVPASSDMVFDYGGEEPPDAVRAGAEPLGPGGESTGSSPRPLATGGSGDRVTIPAEVPAGVYVVNVSVQVPEGDASYYFDVVVEGGGAALPADGGPEDRSG